jgi:hypothetical protein
MKYFFYVVFTTFCLHFGLISCKTDPADIPVKVEIERFDIELMAVKSKAELAGLFAKNPAYTKSLYRAMPDDTGLIGHVFFLTSHPDTRKFHAETSKNFGDLTTIKNQFITAFQHMKAMYPTFKEPKIMTTFTGLENDLFVSDSLIIISLEAFNGPKATYRPDQPNYLLRRYAPEYIVPMAVRYLSNSYNKTDQGDQTFLGDMIYFGKSLEFTKQMMPETPDSLILGYSGKELDNTWAAQDLIWAHTVEKTLLYNKTPQIKEKYLGERPNVPEIGPACPGRIGQWLGWRILKRYMNENPKLTFQEVMAKPNSEEILRLSGYRGQVDDKK